MPIEIKELHIKAVITSENHTRENRNNGFDKADVIKLKKELTNEVLAEVLRRMKQRNER
ncbi:DUF5908 family protein [Parapedobacter tibetensis]|uniref:DUF5908 family protein n=1 Tax=Parapedobacter tibetensis TaxID=2972951 RepID=UPI00214DC961|nr:DUF5908 family protein [Parapedobacter tibetensis]